MSALNYIKQVRSRIHSSGCG